MSGHALAARTLLAAADELVGGLGLSTEEIGRAHV